MIDIDNFIKAFCRHLEMGGEANTILLKLINSSLKEQNLKYEEGQLTSIDSSQAIKDIEAITNEPLEPAITSDKWFFESPKKIVFSDKPDIDWMVEKYKQEITNSEFYRAVKPYLDEILSYYRKGLEDMFNVMRKKYD